MRMTCNRHNFNTWILLLSTLFLIQNSCVRLDEPPELGLILHMSFDNDIKDRSVFANHGIDYTSGTYVDGRWDEAIDLNGYSDYIKLTNTIYAGEGLSFSFWIKSRGAYGTENNGAIVSKYNMTGHQRSFMIYSFGAYETRSDNRLSAAFYKQSYSASLNDHVKSYLERSELDIFPDPTLWTILSPRRIEKDKWMHCVINVTENEIQAWLNGVLCVKKKREHSEYFDSDTEAVYIGNNMSGGAGSNNHYNGALDELRIYNRELTAKEIQILYKNK